MLKVVKQLFPNSLKKSIGQSLSFLHKGQKYTCPFCGFNAKSLKPIGVDIPVFKEKQIVGGGARLGGCYNCGSMDRERLVYVYMKEEAGILERVDSLKVLHIAPEKYLSKKLLQTGFKEYICGDLFTEGYHYPVHVQNMNVLNIPFEDGYFNLVICNHVLEHVPEDLKAMKEIYRVLKVGGKAILQVPISMNTVETHEDLSITDPKEREKYFGQFDHVRLYGQDYSNRLASVGFNINKINISKKYEKFGLVENEDLYVASK